MAHTQGEPHLGIGCDWHRLVTQNRLFWSRFRLRRPSFRAFSDDRMPFGWGDRCPRRSTRRVSASLGRRGGCAKLPKNRTQRPTNLLGAGWASARLPRATCGGHQRTSQHQLVTYHRDHIRPTLDLLGPYEFEEDGKTRIGGGFISYYPTYWNTQTQANEAAPPAQKAFYKQLLTYIRANAVKTKAGMRTYWVGNSTATLFRQGAAALPDSWALPLEIPPG